MTGKRIGLWITIGIVLFIGFMIYSTRQQSKYRVEACMEFQGRTDCRTASGPTEQQALRTAVENACALISSGMTDSIACGNTTPKSVRWLSGK